MIPRSHSISVLVVEDEALLLMIAVDAMKDAGFDVFEASTAAQAVALIGEQGPVTVLFTDVEMPGEMDGLRLAQHVSNCLAVKRIIVTSGRREVASGDLPSNAVFVRKPYSLSSIVETVKSMAA